MGVFDDTKLEQLDWMTQMTETIDSDLNSLLAKLPDRTPITVDYIIEGGNSYLSLSVRNLVSLYIANVEKDLRLSWDEERCIDGCFNFEILGAPELDLRTKVISGGEIFMVKTVATLSDEELQPLMGKRGISAIGRNSSFNGAGQVERLNEVLDILGGCSEAIKNRSGKKKASAIRTRLTEIFLTNEWRIRDMNLANKIGPWIMGYVVYGNLADLTNLCKLKVMTHSNMPIYSVKEEQ